MHQEQRIDRCGDDGHRIAIILLHPIGRIARDRASNRSALTDDLNAAEAIVIGLLDRDGSRLPLRTGEKHRHRAERNDFCKIGSWTHLTFIIPHLESGRHEKSDHACCFSPHRGSGPCVVGVGTATQMIKTGDIVEVDGSKGIVRVIRE